MKDHGLSNENSTSESASDSSVRVHIDDALQDHRKHGSMSRTRSRRGSNSSAGSSNDLRGSFSFQSRRRPRGMSRSSIYSSKSSRTDKSTGGPKESDEESNKSIGETDEDVCFPMDQYDEDSANQNVNITELDQLLNSLSDTEDAVYNEVEDAPQGQDSVETKVEIPVDSPSPVDVPPSLANDSQFNSVIKSPGELEIPFIPSRTHMPKLQLPQSAQGGGSAVEVDVDVEAVSNAQQRFSFFGTKMESTIHAPDLASLVGPDESFSSLFDSKNGVWWLDCLNPSDQEMKVISRAFGIHPLTAEDIRTEESREKFELFKNYYFVSFHTFESDPSNRETYLEPINFYIIVYADGVLSFHFSPVEHCRNVRRRMRQLRDYVSVTSDWICYALIDDIVDSFAPVLHEIEAEADYIEDMVYVNPGTASMSVTLARLVEARRKTMSVMRLLQTKADVIKGFAKRCNESWKNMPGSDIALFLGDIQDHIVTMHQNLSAYEKIFSRSHVNYMAQLQVEFVNSSNRMTAVLGKATMIGTILVPMNLITGLFGMNVKVPGEGVENLHWFFGILSLVIVLIVGLGLGANMYMARLTRE